MINQRVLCGLFQYFIIFYRLPIKNHEILKQATQLVFRTPKNVILVPKKEKIFGKWFCKSDNSKTIPFLKR